MRISHFLNFLLLFFHVRPWMASNLLVEKLFLTFELFLLHSTQVVNGKYMLPQFPLTIHQCLLARGLVSVFVHDAFNQANSSLMITFLLFYSSIADFLQRRGIGWWALSRTPLLSAIHVYRVQAWANIFTRVDILYSFALVCLVKWSVETSSLVSSRRWGDKTWCILLGKPKALRVIGYQCVCLASVLWAYMWWTSIDDEISFRISGVPFAVAGVLFFSASISGAFSITDVLGFALLSLSGMCVSPASTR